MDEDCSQQTKPNDVGMAESDGLSFIHLFVIIQNKFSLHGL